MSRIAVVGSINTDFVVRSERFPFPGETLIGSSFAVYGGGKGANQAIAAARLGATVEFFGAIGRDPQSVERVQQLAADGVGTDQIIAFDGYGGIAFIQVEASSGQNSITLVPGANMLLTPECVLPALSTWCQTGDLICCQLEVPLDTVEQSFGLKERFGLTTMLNAAPFDARVSRFLPLVDYLIVNEIEAGQILSEGPVSLDAAAVAGERLLALGIGAAVLVTLGAHGAVLVDRIGALSIPAPTVPVVDTTGAGDAFVGAFCAEVAAGNSPRDAARSAVRAGSLAVQKAGAQPSLPTAAELAAFFSDR
ncbi:MAG TPA: ribokinase [Nitrolancea sp.]|nr:ribokinase [Nitrolancea sp.]